MSKYFVIYGIAACTFKLLLQLYRYLMKVQIKSLFKTGLKPKIYLACVAGAENRARDFRRAREKRHAQGSPRLARFLPRARVPPTSSSFPVYERPWERGCSNSRSILLNACYTG